MTRAPNDARLWSDLSAARFEANDLLGALVAADRARRINPALADALHNRALILERLGLTPVAVEAWRECLEATADGTMATFVRDRLRIAEKSDSNHWPVAEKELRQAAAANDHATVDRIADEFPELVRSMGEAVYLANWARARGNDPAGAEVWLRIARNIGAALRRREETFVAEAVGAIDEATARNDGPRVAALVRAHLAYDLGRRAYGDREYGKAEQNLRHAAAAFRSGRSPMERVAQSFIASLLVDVSRIDEARGMLSSVLATEQPLTGHRGLVANSQYLLAICDALGGRWNSAVDAAKSSATLFHDLGETASAARSEGLVGDILDLLGRPDEGATYRLRAFRTAGAAGALNTLVLAVGSGSRAAMRARDWELALSLLDVEMALAAQMRDALLSGDISIRRARTQHERNMTADRDIAIGRARIAIGAGTDEAERALQTMELDRVEAEIVRARDPRRAIELLGRAVKFSRETNRRIYVHAILLQRGRAYAAMGDDDRAWQDFSTAMDELEGQREAIRDLALRSRLFDAADELFEESIELQVRAGDAEQAFRVAERARARSLLDVLGGAPRPVASSAAVASRLAPGTLLIEYVMLPTRLVVFTIRADGLRMHTVAVKRGELTSQPGGEILLGPARQEIAAARSLIIVPDKILQRTAFGALPWNGRYLTETHVVSEAPSASLLVAAAAPKVPAQRSVLIVGNPAPDAGQKLAALPSVKREIAGLRAIYPEARTLFDTEATKARFAREAPSYAVIHFAGHGISDEASYSASLLFNGDGAGSGRMYMSEIAKLKLERSPLVVLSACGTLRGRIAGVDGMPSLARSFIAAGASAVVGTLTDVDDGHAADLLTSFHRHIRGGMRPAEALREAQLTAIARGGDGADPKNWAQFVVYTTTPE